MSGKKTESRIPVPKTFPGKAPELDSMTAQSGRSYKETAPGCHVFLYWIDKPRAKGLTGEQIQAGPRRSPVGAGDCPERKQKRRIPIPKTFPGKAPELE